MNICTDAARVEAQHIGDLHLEFTPYLEWLLQPILPLKAGLSLKERAAGGYYRGPQRRLQKTRQDLQAAKLKSASLLTFDHRRDRNCAGTMAYYARCTCGKELFLNAKEALALHTLDAGCLQDDCGVTPARLRMWYHPETAAALQITQLDALFPQRVPKEWRNLQVNAVASLLLARRGDTSHKKRGCWWFQGLTGVSNIEKPSAINKRDTILCTNRPDPVLFPNGEVIVNVEGELMSAAAVAVAFSVKEEDVVNLKSLYWDIDLTNEILELPNEHTN